MLKELRSGRKAAVGLVVTGIITAMALPGQALDQKTTDQRITPNDPHYVNNKSDLQLKLNVKREIALSPYVDADFIHVTVRNGEVTLRGSVEDQSAADAAVENAREAGAKKVINKLNIEDK